MSAVMRDQMNDSVSHTTNCWASVE